MLGSVRRVSIAYLLAQVVTSVVFLALGGIPPAIGKWINLGVDFALYLLLLLGVIASIPGDSPERLRRAAIFCVNAAIVMWLKYEIVLFVREGSPISPGSIFLFLAFLGVMVVVTLVGCVIAYLRDQGRE